jgi:hypothetical protein
MGASSGSVHPRGLGAEYMEEPTLAGLTIRGYAQHRGVSHTAVRKAPAAGHITTGPDGIARDQALSATLRGRADNVVLRARHAQRVRQFRPGAASRETAQPRKCL